MKSMKLIMEAFQKIVNEEIAQITPEDVEAIRNLIAALKEDPQNEDLLAALQQEPVFKDKNVQSLEDAEAIFKTLPVEKPEDTAARKTKRRRETEMEKIITSIFNLKDKTSIEALKKLDFGQGGLSAIPRIIAFNPTQKEASEILAKVKELSQGKLV